MKTSVDSQGYRTPKRFAIDYTGLYKPEDLSTLDAETLSRIRGEVEDKDRIAIPREQLFRETKHKIEEKTSNNVWEVGYWSTDDEEDNDSDYAGPEEDNEGDEDDEDYDEEEDEEEDKDEDLPDPTDKIKQEKYEQSL